MPLQRHDQFRQSEEGARKWCSECVKLSTFLCKVIQHHEQTSTVMVHHQACSCWGAFLWRQQSWPIIIGSCAKIQWKHILFISTQTFHRVLIALVDSCNNIYWSTTALISRWDEQSILLLLLSLSQLINCWLCIWTGQNVGHVLLTISGFEWSTYYFFLGKQTVPRLDKASELNILSHSQEGSTVHGVSLLFQFSSV